MAPPHRIVTTLPLALLLALAACGDAGTDPDGGADAGGPDGGGDPLTCEDGGDWCADGASCIESQCVQVQCTPEETRCDGLLVQTCREDGSGYGPAEHCVDGLCRDGACVDRAECVDELPPCCWMPKDCGDWVTPESCPECRAIYREAYCEAGQCIGRPPGSTDVTVAATTKDLPTSVTEGIHSGVLTIYRGVSADGRPVTCAWLLDDSDGAAPHDDTTTYPRPVAFLNTVASKHYDFSTVISRDILLATYREMPPHDDYTVVFSAYSATMGEGPLAARGCAEGQSALDATAEWVVDLEVP